MRKLVTIVVLLCMLSQTWAQNQIGFVMPANTNKVAIPFEQINNLIVIPVFVNRFLKLKFIVDTGVETAILTEPAFVSILNVELVREITISGVGIRDSIQAFVASDVKFDLPGGISGKGMSMLVLEEDFLKLSERMGKDVHGIIGYDIFSRFVVEVDYNSQNIYLHRPESFKQKRRMTPMNLEVDNSRPYVEVHLPESKDSVRLMVDSGASHAVLLDPDQSEVSMPEKTIDTRLGTGLGGEILGKLGRLSNVTIDEFSFDDVLVSVPNDDAYSKLIKRGSRQGTLGSEILSRLNPIFDYSRGKIYFDKNKNFKKPFEADMSGMDLVVKGRFLDTLYVDYVRKDSPAAEAGVQRGDVIQFINSTNLGLSTFGQIQGLLKRRPKRKIRLKILRNGEKVKIQFKLKRQI